MSLIAKMKLFGSALVFSTPLVNKTQCFFDLSFNLTLELNSGICSGHQELLRYFNDKAIVAFSRIPFVTAVIRIILGLNFKDLKLSLSGILVLNC